MRLNQDLVNLLRALEGRVGDADKKTINQVLQNVEDDLVSLDSVQLSKTLGKRPREPSSGEKDPETTNHGEAFVTASVGSNEDLDFLDEDLMRNREARETGYIGQNSEVQWLRSVQRQAERGSTNPEGQRHGPPGSSSKAVNERVEALHERRQNTSQGSMQHTTDATFYLDSDDIEIDIAVDPYEMPEPGVAENLFNCYLETVHSTFPLMPVNFEGQFRRYIQSAKQKRQYEIPPKWRITMNLLFAIGAKYSQLIGAPWRGDERDHLIYMTRAVHLLRLGDPIVFIAAPTMDRVQATGALAFYFLAIGHVSRAWIMIGVSIRLALALGLHLRNENTALEDSKKEPLVRTWWCLHAIECLVSSITGRPPVIGHEDCTVSLPKSNSGPLNPDNSSSRQSSRVRTSYESPQSSARSSASQSDRGTDDSSYLVAYINLNLISQKVLLSLYSPRTAARSWEHIQTRITELLNELDDWAKIASPSEDLHASSWAPQPDVDRERYLFRIYYWSTRILITRPCLCRIERRIESESSRSAIFNAKTAELCVQAAEQITSLFPDQPDKTFIYSHGPWWDVVHIIMQSMAVLLLEMSYEGQNLKDDKENIMKCIKKLMSWLRALRVNDPVASRAHGVVYKILNTCAPSLREQVKELMNDDGDQPSQSRTWERSQDFNIPQQESWDTSSEPIYPAVSSQTFPPFLSEQFPDPIYPYPIEYDQSMAFSFGNPFTTTFDQGPPILDMQNLWWQSASSANMSLDPSELVMPYQQQPQPQQPQPQQQMHDQIHQGIQQTDWMHQPDGDDDLDQPPQQ
ncbi:hypothetical protein COCVIDRAFT_38446 [Bipolaris victoriae FI3]|uniref:Xylanolytic transcriptional activator regulatory domain-containing protein n=1 Tax=Bipolaris victoriae (strain FI3) TaxID=930091 RepID=W7EQ58_BIPV3|nr:hypothetical protein COCVIDRAFT_38446 [Bipolaris victoriae FI3]